MTDMVERSEFEIVRKASRLFEDASNTWMDRALKAEAAVDQIWKIVHTPTKDTRHRSADDHFQADFDSIRKIIADARKPAFSQEIRK